MVLAAKVAANHSENIQWTTNVNRHLALSGVYQRRLQAERRNGLRNWKPRDVASINEIRKAVA
jgi:hypothetical protein